MNDQLKCGRKTYNLVKGDRVMDNGACFQLITRSTGYGYRTYHPAVSKKAFSLFKKMNVKSVSHGYGEWVVIWEYQGAE